MRPSPLSRSKGRGLFAKPVGLAADDDDLALELSGTQQREQFDPVEIRQTQIQGEDVRPPIADQIAKRSRVGQGKASYPHFSAVRDDQLGTVRVVIERQQPMGYFTCLSHSPLQRAPN